MNTFLGASPTEDIGAYFHVDIHKITLNCFPALETI